MVSFDLASLSVREVNEQLRAAGAAGEDVQIVNPDARHHIGVGLTEPIKVTIEGSAGYFCAGLSDQAQFEVTHKFGWGVGGEYELSTHTFIHHNIPKSAPLSCLQ